MGFSPARSLLVRLLLCTEKQTEKQHLLPRRGRAVITMGRNPASGHTLLVLHFQAQSPGLTIRHGRNRMPKPFNLQLVHLNPNSNLLGFELKQHMYTHTHIHECAFSHKSVEEGKTKYTEALEAVNVHLQFAINVTVSLSENRRVSASSSQWVNVLRHLSSVPGHSRLHRKGVWLRWFKDLGDLGPLCASWLRPTHPFCLDSGI